MKQIVSALALMWSAAAWGSHFFDTHELMKRCDQTAPWELRASPFDYGSCIGYLSGIVDTIATDRANFCLPASVNAEQLRRAWVHQAKNRSEKRHLLADVSVVAAFARVWPCDK